MNRELLRKHCEKMCKMYESAPLSNAYMEHKLVLKLLEQTTWIPCSEDLPIDNGWYQCTVALDNSLLTMDLYYKNGKWLDNRRINMFNKYDIYGYGNTTEKHKLSYQELISEFDWTKNVVAWMPLTKAESEKRMEDTKQCCNPFPCPYVGKDKTCEECNCYRDDYWNEG